jgi:hypothetical protein
MGRAVPGRTRYGARARTRTIRSNIQRVASSATERDQLICVDLYEHRILTTNQLCELHFASLQRTRARLLQLHDMGVLWRNRPRAQLGSLPWHYTLDEIGAWIVAEHLGIELRAVGYRDDRKRTLVDSPRLSHTRAANSFFTRMIYVARSTESTVQVAEWVDPSVGWEVTCTGSAASGSRTPHCSTLVQRTRRRTAWPSAGFSCTNAETRTGDGGGCQRTTTSRRRAARVTAHRVELSARRSARTPAYRSSRSSRRSAGSSRSA